MNEKVYDSHHGLILKFRYQRLELTLLDMGFFEPSVTGGGGGGECTTAKVIPTQK